MTPASSPLAAPFTVDIRLQLAGVDPDSDNPTAALDLAFHVAEAARAVVDNRPRGGPARVEQLGLVLPAEVHDWAMEAQTPPCLPGCTKTHPPTLLGDLRESYPTVEVHRRLDPQCTAAEELAALRAENERHREALVMLLELAGKMQVQIGGSGERPRETAPDGAERRGDVPGAFEELVRQAGGAGYLTHLDPQVMQMRPRDLLAEALKFGSEAARDLGVLRQGRPDSSRMRVEFGTEGYALPIDIAGEYLRADVGSTARIAVLLAGVAGVSDRVRELEEAAEAAASRIEVDSESDSIDDRFAAAAEAVRLLRRAL